MRSEGPQAAIAFLNAGVPHRYAAAYQLTNGILHNVLLVDKAGEVTPEHLMSVPLGTSFCQFVIRDGLFRTQDSGSDVRLAGHPYQGVMQSYHGVPLLGADGEVRGTLCHFDVVSLPISDDEFALLQSAAQMVSPEFT